MLHESCMAMRCFCSLSASGKSFLNAATHGVLTTLHHLAQLMEQDAIALPPSPSATGSAASPREQLFQQLRSGGQGADGGIFAQLTSNPFFTAGFGLAALGTTATVGLKALRTGATLLRRRLLVDVEITRADESYHWFLKWMSEYHRAQLEAPFVSLKPQISGHF